MVKGYEPRMSKEKEQKLQGKASHRIIRVEIIIGVLVLGLIIFFLSFHLVFPEHNRIQIVSKEHLTFRLSVVSVSGLIERWNTQMNLLDRIDDKLLRHLVNELERRGIIEFED